jgi:methylenetetrahydrofolate dehydrogenase (NADP+) / methenyltetrahydrofolate cyclohydrolase
VTATLIDGIQLSKHVRAQVAARTAQLKAEQGITPGLAVILVGDDPASQVYVGNKSKLAKEVGITPVDYRLPETASADEVIALLNKLNAQPDIHSILLQLPLPKHLDTNEILTHIKRR